MHQLMGRRGRKGKRRGRGGGKGGVRSGGMEDRNSDATLFAYCSRFVDSNSLHGGWYWPQT